MDHFVERERVRALNIMAKRLVKWTGFWAGNSQAEISPRETLTSLLFVSRFFTYFSYRPSLALSFICSELAFESFQHADTFLNSLSADIYIDPTPAEASSISKRKRVVLPPLEQRLWDAKTAMPFLIAAEEKHKKIDVSFVFQFDRIDEGEAKSDRERACNLLLKVYPECMPTFSFVSPLLLPLTDQRSNLEPSLVKSESACSAFEIELKARVNSQLYLFIFFQFHSFDSLFFPTDLLPSFLCSLSTGFNQRFPLKSSHLSTSLIYNIANVFSSSRSFQSVSFSICFIALSLWLKYYHESSYLSYDSSEVV